MTVYQVGEMFEKVREGGQAKHADGGKRKEETDAKSLQKILHS